jgi:hypothetical protein
MRHDHRSDDCCRIQGSPLAARPHLARWLKTYTWIHPLFVLGTVAALFAAGHRNVDWRLGAPSPLGVVVILLMVFPALQSAISAIVGFSLPLRSGHDLRSAPDLRRLRRLHLCVVSKGVNTEALRRTYEHLRPLMDERMRLDVVTDLPVDLPHIRVPDEFSTGRARFKARALEYYRLVMNLSRDDWVLHLDEETVLDRDDLEACIRFCKRSPHLMGQGIIFYNNHGFWRHRLIAVADAVRTGDDMGRFFAQLAWIHRPIFGVHGSFLLVNGTIENEITWNLDGYLVEDYAFSLHYMQRGYTCGHIDGFAREQSPLTLVDFLKQRRRWVVGIRGLSYHSLWPAYWVTLWQMAPFARALSIAAATVRFGPWWFLLSSDFAFVTYLYLYLVGMLVQDVDRGSSAGTTAWHLVQVTLLFPLAMLLETAGVVWAIFTRRRTLEFQVVKK